LLDGDKDAKEKNDLQNNNELIANQAKVVEIKSLLNDAENKSLKWLR
jgi:hypothetical protein